MDDQSIDMPHIDETVTAANLHARAEAVAVPCMDWLNQPLIAVIDGLTHSRADGTRTEHSDDDAS